MPRPIVLYSMCLGIKPVRYDGNIIFDEFAEALKKYVEVIPVCPEADIGLGVPRNPLVLHEEDGNIELLDTVTGLKYSKRMEEFTRSLLERITIDGVLLKASSPSCGVGDAKIYGKGRVILRRGDGYFTSLLKKHLFCIPIESEKRLYSYEIRRRFLTRLFSLADVRLTTSSIKDREELVDLHRRYKYLIMLHSPMALKNLGRLVANRKQHSIEDLVKKYNEEFKRALCRNPSRRSYENVFMHMYGHLKKELNPSERRYAIDLIKKYGTGKESLRTVMAYFRSFIYRLGETYLSEQRFLAPYPDELDLIGFKVD